MIAVGPECDHDEDVNCVWCWPSDFDDINVARSRTTFERGYLGGRLPVLVDDEDY